MLLSYVLSVYTNLSYMTAFPASYCLVSGSLRMVTQNSFPQWMNHGQPSITFSFLGVLKIHVGRLFVQFITNISISSVVLYN
jgi:hypothetical protein